jgi:hypothetical protein
LPLFSGLDRLPLFSLADCSVARSDSYSLLGSNFSLCSLFKLSSFFVSAMLLTSMHIFSLWQQNVLGCMRAT